MYGKYNGKYNDDKHGHGQETQRPTYKDLWNVKIVIYIYIYICVYIYCHCIHGQGVSKRRK